MRQRAHTECGMKVLGGAGGTVSHYAQEKNGIEHGGPT